MDNILDQLRPEVRQFLVELDDSQFQDAIAQLINLGFQKASMSIEYACSNTQMIRHMKTLNKSSEVETQAIKDLKLRINMLHNELASLMTSQEPHNGSRKQQEKLNVEYSPEKYCSTSSNQQQAALSPKSLRQSILQPSRVKFIKNTHMQYPEWWGGNGSCNSSSIMEQEWHTPKKLTAESLTHPNPAVVKLSAKQELKDQQLRMAARRQLDPRLIDGFDAEQNNQIPTGWIPFETPQKADVRQSLQPRSVPRTAPQLSKSVNSTDTKQASHYQKSRPHNNNIKDFISIAQDFAQSDLIKIIE
ncbi:hypothetical protein MP228_009917 [Amoeboaphelidium protococcarum]|nr:hypothetical protein MP228_009917 [Amoeboaphelidium protococcarum]